VSDLDPAVTYERLKIETASMLNLDAASLSLVENLQLDLVSLLRLEVDTLQGQVLAGEQVDLGRLSTSLAMLRQLLPERALVAPAPAPEARFGNDARKRLRRLIEQTLLGGEEIVDESQEALERQFRDHDAREREERLFNHPDEARAALEAEIAAAQAKRGNIANPAGGDVQVDSDAARPSPVPTPAGGVPTLVEPTPPAPVAPPQQTSSQPPLRPPGSPIPARRAGQR
jgi:hypothetical protein